MLDSRRHTRQDLRVSDRYTEEHLESSTTLCSLCPHDLSSDCSSLQDLPGPARLLRAPAGMCYCATRRLPPPPSDYGRSVARSTLSREKRVVYAADGPQATMSSWPRPYSTPFDLPLARASTCSVGVLAPRRDLTIHLRSLPVRRNSVRQHLITRQPPSDSGPVQADCRSQLSQGRAVGALYMNEDVAS